jgi:hypothetical protein
VHGEVCVCVRERERVRDREREISRTRMSGFEIKKELLVL